MSAVAITRRMAFVSRIERRAGLLGPAEQAALLALYHAHDTIGMRAYLAGHGFQLATRRTYIAGVPRAFLVRRRAA